MSTRRMAKAAQAIREVVSTAILTELKDPRIQNVTVLNVEASGDLRHAKVYISIMGDDRAQSLCLHGLHSARGFLQSKIADCVQTRYTPVLEFVIDPGVKQSIATSKLLKELSEEWKHDPPQPDEASPDLASETDRKHDPEQSEHETG